MSFKNASRLSGLIVFIISFIVYYFTVERTGSLWDCGEFVLGAYKLQVVHPPGAPLFLLIGRLFTWVASVVSSDPASIAFAVNLMSGICTALAAALVAMTTTIFGKIALVGRDGETGSSDNIAILIAGLAAGLTTAFCTSIWFSAVEGEVYAMSTFFTALTYYAAVKWYSLSDDIDNDRWLVFSIFAAGLSIGVHLLSLLTFPAISLLYYFKKFKGKISILGVLGSMAAGAVVIAIIQKIVIVGIPTLWYNFELLTVNTFGLPQHSGIVPTLLLLVALGYFLLKYAHSKGNYLLQLATVSLILVSIAFSTIMTVVIRANADTPVNMNTPSDAMRLLPYLNREQYGERPLLRGPKYDAKPSSVDKEDRYGFVDGKYVKVDEKYTHKFANKDKILFPRIGHTDGSKPALHNKWRDALYGNHNGSPSYGYNIQYLMKYQLGWMYWRYFMWNFVGKQNGAQGYYPWDVKSGHWQSGISFVDESRLYNMEALPDTMKNDPSKNFYYFLPLIFGIIGLLFHAKKSKKEFVSLLMLFIVTGIGIIIYSNQPPGEPRERDYVLVGSFMAYSMWIGMAVISIYRFLRAKMNDSPMVPTAVAAALVLSAPVIMGFQNFDDHSRRHHTGARDYASNFLHSVDKNAIIFTYGDNDTYPLWYAQEVEGIRRDVRVVNLSLIAVDWYIDKLRSKVNESDPIKLTVSQDAYRGNKNNQVFFYNPQNPSDQVMDNMLPLNKALELLSSGKATMQGQTIIPSKKFFMPVDKGRVLGNPLFPSIDTSNIVNIIPISYSKDKRYILKDELAVMDVINSNFYDRPIYFATTVLNEKLLGLNEYTQMEGLSLRLVPKRTKSDRSLGIYGSGTIDVDKTYNHIMDDWRWGNFDKVDTYVNGNYMAAVQSMKMSFMRTGARLMQQGDKERTKKLVRKYFEAFPHMNFPYDGAVTPFIKMLIQAEDYEEAKKHLRILAEETRQHLVFYKSLDGDAYKSFQNDARYKEAVVYEILRMCDALKDPEFKKEMEALIGQYMPKAPNKQ